MPTKWRRPPVNVSNGARRAVLAAKAERPVSASKAVLRRQQSGHVGFCVRLYSHRLVATRIGGGARGSWVGAPEPPSPRRAKTVGFRFRFSNIRDLLPREGDRRPPFRRSSGLLRGF